MANYAQRRDELIMSGFRAGDATGEQRTADYFAIALHSPDVMGKDILSAKRIKKIYAKVHELEREFAQAFQKGDEQDYCQSQLDRTLAQIFPPEDFVPFAVRYPNIKKPK